MRQVSHTAAELVGGTNSSPVGGTHLPGPLRGLVGRCRFNAQGARIVFCGLQFSGVGCIQRSERGQLFTARCGRLQGSGGLSTLGTRNQAELVGFDLGQGIAGAGSCGFITLGQSRLQTSLLLSPAGCQVLPLQLNFALRYLQASLDGGSSGIKRGSQFIRLGSRPCDRVPQLGSASPDIVQSFAGLVSALNDNFYRLDHRGSALETKIWAARRLVLRQAALFWGEGG